MGLIKDLSDDALEAFIRDTRVTLNGAFAVKDRSANVPRMLRELDIAVAIKRKRARAAS